MMRDQYSRQPSSLSVKYAKPIPPTIGPSKPATSSTLPGAVSALIPKPAASIQKNHVQQNAAPKNSQRLTSLGGGEIAASSALSFMATAHREPRRANRQARPAKWEIDYARLG
jgi:hypothetical protein